MYDRKNHSDTADKAKRSYENTSYLGIQNITLKANPIPMITMPMNTARNPVIRMNPGASFLMTIHKPLEAQKTPASEKKNLVQNDRGSPIKAAINTDSIANEYDIN